MSVTSPTTRKSPLHEMTLSTSDAPVERLGLHPGAYLFDRTRCSGSHLQSGHRAGSTQEGNELLEGPHPRDHRCEPFCH